MRTIKRSLWLFLFLNSPLNASDKFPLHPNPVLTPGSLCDDPDYYRYSERIPYCNRDVSSSTKRWVIRNYDQTLGYAIEQMNRGDFKVDHYIPLCMGGSNSVDNLWPQHRQVYEITDPVEGRLCDLVARGAIKQKEAVELIMLIKNDFSEAERVWEQIAP